MKKKREVWFPNGNEMKLQIRKMKLTSILLFIVCVTFGNSFSQVRLTVRFDKTEIRNVIQTIEDKTDYIFLYKDKIFDFSQKVTAEFDNAKFEDVLKSFCDQTNTSFEIRNRQIILKEKEVVAPMELQQQKKEITGKVTDSGGLPLPGVSVVVKGTTTGTITDADGKFSLSNISENATLQFSFVGMKGQEVQVVGKTTINITLTEDAIGLEEVVAIGYGTQKKSDLTGAVASVDSKMLEMQPVTTLEEGIQGKLAGVQILQSSGQPGAGTSIRIRGVASLSGSSEPLYVIDGIPQFNPDNREANGLGNIDPAEIASVEVLKDAASAAIYGSRAANGVVIVTTKSGKSGKTQLKYSSNFGMQNVSNKLDLMSGPEYYDFVMTYFDNSIADGEATIADKSMAESQFASMGIDNINWQNKMFHSALKQDHNLSLSGGDDKNKYFILTSITDQSGIVENTGFKRYTIRLNLDNKLGERFNLNSKINASRSVQDRFVSADGTNNYGDGKSGIASILSAEPTVPPLNANGNLNDIRLYSFSAIGNVNPLAFLDAVDKRTNYRVDGVIEGHLELAKGLVNTTRLGATYDRVKIDMFQPKTVIMNAQLVELDTRDNLNLLAENFLSFDKQINSNIGVNLTAGVSFQNIQTELLMISGQGLPDDVLKNNALQALSSISPPVTNNIDQTLVSFFARGNMNIKDKYLLSASIRKDGASQFAEGNKYATFPAVSMAWRISEEDFLSGSVISNMKLRLSWGQSGNQAISPYQSLTIGNVVSTPTGSGTGLNTAIVPNLPNKSLTWETSTQSNIGLDLGFARQKYWLGLDVYEKTTDDLLANVLLPPSAGFTYIIDNLGEIRNRGVEIQVGTDLKLTPDLKFILDGNVSKNVNKVIKTNNGKDIITGGSNDRTDTQLLVREGEPLSSFFMIKYLGLDENGNPFYDDIDKNGIIDGRDNQIVGNPLPDLVYGFNVSLEYKKFSLALNWQGIAGSMVYNSKLNSMVTPMIGNNKRVDLYEFYPRPSHKAATLNRASSMFLEDASYLRLKNIKLNYSVPNNKLGFISGLDVYVSAQNLLTFTKYSGYDPEVNSFSGGDLRQGIDLSAYPSTRTFTVGLNVTF